MATRDTVGLRKDERITIKDDCYARRPRTLEASIPLKRGRKGTYRGDAPSGHPEFGLVELDATDSTLSAEFEVAYAHLTSDY